MSKLEIHFSGEIVVFEGENDSDVLDQACEYLVYEYYKEEQERKAK